MSRYANLLARRLLDRSTTWTLRELRVAIERELGHRPTDQLVGAVCLNLGGSVITPEQEELVKIIEWVAKAVDGVALDAIDWDAVYTRAVREGVTSGSKSSFMSNYAGPYERKRRRSEKRRERTGAPERLTTPVLDNPKEGAVQKIAAPHGVDELVDQEEEPDPEPEDRGGEQYDGCDPEADGFPSIHVEANGRVLRVSQQGDGLLLVSLFGKTFTPQEARDIFGDYIEEHLAELRAPTS